MADCDRAQRWRLVGALPLKRGTVLWSGPRPARCRRRLPRTLRIARHQAQGVLNPSAQGYKDHLIGSKASVVVLLCVGWRPAGRLPARSLIVRPHRREFLFGEVLAAQLVDLRLFILLAQTRGVD